MKKLIPLLFLTIIFSCNKNAVESDSAKNKTYLKAANYRDAGEKDSAYIYYALAKDDFLKKNDSIFVAKCLVNLAIIQTEKGDNFGGIETSLEAEKYLKKNNEITREIKSSNYNNLALAHVELKDYKKSEKYYFLALNQSNNSLSKLIFYNNIANNFLDQKNYQSAKTYYKKALKTQDSLSYARALNNWGRCLYLENKNTKVLPYFQKALLIRTILKDYWGLNSSYGTLADYYKEINPLKSIFYAKKMYEVALKIENPDDRLEALEQLITLEKSDHSKKYFSEYQKLNDSLQTARAKARNQFALIRYETEKAKTENIEKENYIFRQRVAIAFLVTGLLVGLFWYLRRKKRLEQEKEIEVKNTQIKYSKKIHDVVANGLYQTMVEVENQEELDKEKLLDKLEKMYEESRDIAHEDLNEQIEKEFSVKLFEMISSYSSPQQKVLVIGNEQNIWQNVSQNIQSEIFYALRELMINMKKHSQATLVSVKFEKIENILKIKYTDNGLGMGNAENKKLSGIKNTENRIENIGGDINFEKNLQKGLQVNISIPIH
ncbi:MAG: tetratricopeptide repeat protein [Cloacibacterium sp.]|uniref:tetratricopeptide repeat-containing sensor histidine kinase n=1 Tax=Cloacibacterium sp. TaxID=1913682 RepID=UPI003C780A1D